MPMARDAIRPMEPDGWRVVRLGEVAEVAFSSVDKKTVDGEAPVELCNYTDVFYNRQIRPGMGFMRASASSAERQKWSLREGDVLFTKDSETPDEIGIPSHVAQDMPNVLCGYHLGLARPLPDVASGAFLARALGSRACAREFARIANGVTRFGLTLGPTRALPILLPPLAEQRGIAAVLDAIDDAIERSEAVIAATEELRRSLLHELLSRGVPGWHSEWREVRGLGVVPACWEVVRLGECLASIEAGRSPLCETRPARQGEWGVLKVSSVTWGTFQSSENKALLPSSEPDPRFEVKAGDIILSRANTPDLVGRAVLVRATRPKLLLSDKTLRLQPDQERIDRRFLLLSLGLPRSRSQISGAASGSSRSMFNVSQESIRQVQIAMPRAEEQRAIADALDAVDATLEESRRGTDVLRSVKASAAEALLSGRVRVPRVTWDQHGET